MFNLSVASKSKPTEKASSVRRSKPEAAGRERLKHLDSETQKAKEAVVEFEQRVQRLESIISDAETAHRVLQQAIAADGGKALEDYAAGLTKGDDEISKLVMTAEQTARAETAARAALPTAQASLENVRAQVIVLGEERALELNRVLSLLADDEARAYKRAFENLGRAHDRLCGWSSVAEMNQGDIRLTQAPLAVPRFASPSLGNADADPFLRHQVNQLDIGDAARMWKEIRGRLELDAGADISDLIGGVK